MIPIELHHRFKGFMRDPALVTLNRDQTDKKVRGCQLRLLCQYGLARLCRHLKLAAV